MATHSSRRRAASILVALLICYSVTFSPLAETGSGHSRLSNGDGNRSERGAKTFFASILALLQGSGGPPSVPGAGLPDLDAARATQPSEPLAPAAIVSTQVCTDCTPCPTCGPGGANHAPVVSAGGPYYGTVGTTTLFNSLGSFDVDPGDGISDYAWGFGDNSAVTHGATPSHTYQAAGN